MNDKDPSTIRQNKRTTNQKAIERGLAVLDDVWQIGDRDFVGFRLAIVAKLIDKCALRLFAEYGGMTIAEWRVLALTSMSSPQTVRRLAETAFVDRAEVSRAAAALVARGILEKRANPEDQRSPLFFITQDGQALFDTVGPIRHEFLRDMLAGVADEERETVDKVLKLFAFNCLDYLAAFDAERDH